MSPLSDEAGHSKGEVKWELPAPAEEAEKEEHSVVQTEQVT